jgi:hypothetical protein
LEEAYKRFVDDDRSRATGPVALLKATTGDDGAADSLEESRSDGSGPRESIVSSADRCKSIRAVTKSALGNSLRMLIVRATSLALSSATGIPIAVRAT